MTSQEPFILFMLFGMALLRRQTGAQTSQDIRDGHLGRSAGPFLADRAPAKRPDGMVVSRRLCAGCSRR